MKIRSSFFNWGFPVAALLLLVILVAWADNPQNGYRADHNLQDTIPSKKRNKITREPGDKDLDKELRELEKAKAELENMKEHDWDNIKKEIEQSLREIDLEKIKLETERAMKQIDLAKMEKEISASLSKIDFDKIEREIERAIEDADVKGELEAAKKELRKAKAEVEMQLKNREWRKEIEQELKKVNSEEIRKEMEKAKQELERAKSDLNLEKLNLGKELDKAKQEIEKAKEEFKGYQEMIYELEKEGYLDTKQDYKIVYHNDNGELIVNGQKLSAETAAKYKKYFKSNKKKTTIIKEDGDFNIDID
jgi:DNA repair exonuclease SbcCD ATPase subunit